MSDNFIFTGVNPDGDDEIIVKHCDGREYKMTGFIVKESIHRDGRYYVLGSGESATYKVVIKGFCKYGEEPEVLKR